MIQQIISKDGTVKCVSSVPYPDDVIKQMKKAGYRIKEKDSAAGCGRSIVSGK